MAGRKVELINDRDLARKRLSIFAGMDMPSTIVRKELIDNEIDVVNERGQKATQCIIRLGKNRIQVMDNGSGISIEKKEGVDKTHLWLACAKMFSSSNYGGVLESVGANGVGMTIANYTSKRFTAAILDRTNKVKGYRFIDGFLCGTEECIDNVNSKPEMFSKRDIEVSNIDGDFVESPIDKEGFMEEFKPFWDEGFMLDVTWKEAPNNLFPDEGCDIEWLIKYTKCRAGEIISGDVFFEVYNSDEFTEENLEQKFHWTKDKNSENYIPSWQESCEKYGAVFVKDGEWTIAFSKDPAMQVESIVQGAPIVSRYKHGCGIEIQDEVITVQVPLSIRYLSTEYPKYQDQTKTSIRFPYHVVYRAFEKAGDIYRHFYREAEKQYMAKVIQDSDSSMFWPSLGDPEESELIIAEGYGAISGLKSQRDPMKQACIALRGKLLNCWNLDMQRAMRADIVKQILNAVIYTPYKRIIIAVDADADGSHIASLLLALFARFTNVIQEGKVYYADTPKYIFKRRRKNISWGDDASECPPGCQVTVLKGLGGMSPSEVEKFIMNEETRRLIQIKWDDEAADSLDHAFSYGGEDWIKSS